MKEPLAVPTPSRGSFIRFMNTYLDSLHYRAIESANPAGHSLLVYDVPPDHWSRRIGLDSYSADEQMTRQGAAPAALGSMALVLSSRRHGSFEEPAQAIFYNDELYSANDGLGLHYPVVRMDVDIGTRLPFSAALSWLNFILRHELTHVTQKDTGKNHLYNMIYERMSSGLIPGARPFARLAMDAVHSFTPTELAAHIGAIRNSDLRPLVDRRVVKDVALDTNF